jgi:hypothetical protein
VRDPKEGAPDVLESISASESFETRLGTVELPFFDKSWRPSEIQRTG